MKAIVFLFLFLILALPALAGEAERESQIDDIREAVFRWQFDHNASGQQKKARIYFLEVGEKPGDPTDQFMNRFADHKPPVRKVSACTLNTGEVRNKKTREKGLIFRVTKIEWKSDIEVEVTGGYHEALLSSSGNTYTVKKENGKWKVTKDKMDWIS
jgi:hypothetical protein